jgi:hypothetical protein
MAKTTADSSAAAKPAAKGNKGKSARLELLRKKKKYKGPRKPHKSLPLGTESEDEDSEEEGDETGEVLPGVPCHWKLSNVCTGDEETESHSTTAEPDSSGPPGAAADSVEDAAAG